MKIRIAAIVFFIAAAEKAPACDLHPNASAPTRTTPAKSRKEAKHFNKKTTAICHTSKNT